MYPSYIPNTSNSFSLSIVCRDGTTRPIYFQNAQELKNLLTDLYRYNLIDLSSYNYYNTVGTQMLGASTSLNVPSPSLSQLSSTTKQRLVEGLIKENKKKFFGTKATIRSSNNRYNNLTGIIVNIIKSRNQWVFVISLDTDGTLHKLKINELDFNISTKDINLKDKEIFIEMIVDNLKKKFPQAKKELKDVEMFNSTIESIRKQKNIEDIAVFEDGGIICITKMLYPTSEITGKTNMKKPIGKFMIKVNDGTIKVINLTYNAGNYYHPNVSSSGSVCWGENQEEINKMYNKFNLYELIDFIVLFLSTFPQKEGDPYVGYSEWMNAREKNEQSVDLSKRIL